MEQQFMKKPWIQNVLLSDNLESPVPKKAKARVTWVNKQKNPDDTQNGEITDCVHKITVNFSEKAVSECLKDKAHGNNIEDFEQIKEGAVVLTDYKVVPMFNEQQFILKVNHFKLVPGYIGRLAYTEEIPENLMHSKDDKEVREKLHFLWRKQHANQGSGKPGTAENNSLENRQTVNESNSQKEGSMHNNVSCPVGFADEPDRQQEQRESLVKLYGNYEPLEDADGLEIQKSLQHIHIAHTNCRADTWTSEEDTDANSDLSELLYQARTKGASFSDVKSHSQSPKGETEAEQDMPTLDVIHSNTPNQSDHHDRKQTVDVTSQKSDTTKSPEDILPGLLGQSAGKIVNLSPSRTSQGSRPANNAATDSVAGVAGALRPNAVTGLTAPDSLCITSQTASDKTKSQDLLSGHKTPVTRPTIPLSQTSTKAQKRQKREAELWKCVCDYWKGKKSQK